MSAKIQQKEKNQKAGAVTPPNDGRRTRSGHGVRFTQAQYSMIVKDYQGGISTKNISQKYGCTQQTVICILHRYGITLRGTTNLEFPEPENIVHINGYDLDEEGAMRLGQIIAFHRLHGHEQISFMEQLKIKK